MAATAENTAVAVREPSLALVAANDPFANWIDIDRFNQVQRIAKVFANCELVPKHYQGERNVPNCIVALQMAMRLQIDPMMFMQNTYIVYGKPGMEAKLAIALINQRGPFKGPIQWRFSGDRLKDDWACTAYATHKATDQVCEATVTWAMVKAEGWLAKDGSKWKTMPDMMFQYRSATFLGRLYCPEVLMGMATADEIRDVGVVEVEATETTRPAQIEVLDQPAGELDIKAARKATGCVPADYCAAASDILGRPVKKMQELTRAELQRVTAQILDDLNGASAAAAEAEKGEPDHGIDSDIVDEARDDINF